jgi:hypothetical protein
MGPTPNASDRGSTALRDHVLARLRKAQAIRIGGVDVPVLPLERIIVSKKAAGRPKALAVLPVLEDVLRAQRRS